MIDSSRPRRQGVRAAPLAALAAIALLLGSALHDEAAAQATSTANPLRTASPEELKAAYLYCDRLATTELFDSAAAASCSLVYEALKARVFSGSTERLIAWMEQQRRVALAGGAGAR